jgi:hypothetical protein
MKTVRILTSLASLVVAGFLHLSPVLAAAPPAAAGDNFFGGRIEVTFIKWVIAWPDMRGVVSGDVGGGQFEGKILDLNTAGDITTIHAEYNILGGAYPQITADNVVTQNNVKGTAVINGVVTSPGPLNGARVQGEYQVISPCNITNAIAGDGGNVCYQGTLVVRPGLGQ